jgi:glucan phosphoethanolaminetransferase (alkaline phosphatase superfamily)
MNYEGKPVFGFIDHLARLRLLALVTVCVAPYLVMAVWLTVHKGVPATAGYLIASSIVVGLLAVIMRYQRRFFLAHFPVLVVTTIFAAFAVVQATLPGAAIAYVLVTSAWEEVLSLFSLWEYQRILLASLAFLILYLALSWGLPARVPLRAGGRLWRRSAIGAFGLLGAAAATQPVDFLEGIAASPAVGAAIFLTGPLAQARAAVLGPKQHKLPYGAVPMTGDALHVLIIGESARRESWSVYGYGRRTTPYLESIRDQAIFFQHAFSDANATIYAVPILLTGINPRSLSMTGFRGNLVDLAKEAGYRTSWLVNNDAWISYLLGMAADDTVYQHTVYASMAINAQPDGVLLPLLQRRLAEHHGLQFIGIHTLGSHVEYSHRYPPTFRHFGSAGPTRFFGSGRDQETLDMYDDSVLYTDWLLGQVIEAARGVDVPTTITYVADHGEELGLLDGRSGHGFPIYSQASFSIPAFVWFNAAFRRAHPDKVAALILNRDQTIRTHDFFYTIADLMGIRWPGFVARRSFASPDFVPDLTSPFIVAGNLMTNTNQPAP